MSPNDSLPAPYFFCVLAVMVLLLQGWQARMQCFGIPMMVVALTIGIWYLIDPIYNGYSQYIQEIGEPILNVAWWEVLLFLFTFGLAVPVVNKWMNGEADQDKSVLFELIDDHKVDTPFFQDQVEKLGVLIFVSWAGLMLLALWRTDFDFTGIFFPYLSDKNDPWSRDRIGSGLDFMISFASYIQIMLTALLGVICAISFRMRPFLLSGVSYLLAVPFYLFDRTRNTMLAVLLPGFFWLVLVRIKGGFLIRLVVILVGFFMIEGWLKFVIATRDTESVAMAFQEGGLQRSDLTNKKHLGLNMFEELGYINLLIKNGTYRPNWGARYFAELVNPIPRSLWSGKPLIGIDYAVARGMAYGNQNAASGGVAASISTGMIGQGVVNFGGFFGPIAAAVIMALWSAILARQDRLGNNISHLLLYSIGLVLTFNMGRDITLLVIYPFVFAWLLIKVINRQTANNLEFYEA